MGYTHYFSRQHMDDPDECFEQFSKLVEMAAEKFTEETGTKLATSFGEELIVVNGVSDEDGDNSHESFWWRRDHAGSEYVKTNLKPYDAFVVACIAIAIEVYPEGSITFKSDGGPSEIGPGLKFAARFMEPYRKAKA